MIPKNEIAAPLAAIVVSKITISCFVRKYREPNSKAVRAIVSKRK